MEKEVKQLFKTVFEFSLYVAKNSQISEVKLGKILGDIPPLELNELILDTILYDFLNKAITLNETKEMLINILKQQHGAELLLIPITDDEYFQEASCFIIPDFIKSAYITDIMKILIQLIHDDEWVIRFFTDYIKEFLIVSRISKDIASLETVDWEQYLVNYLIGEVAGEVQIL